MAIKTKTAAKSGASRYQVLAKKPISNWLWMATGLTVSIFIVILMKLEPGKGDTVKRIKQEQQIPESNKIALIKSKYDFYTLLPESEVVGPTNAVPEKILPTPQISTTPVILAKAETVDTTQAPTALAAITELPLPVVASTKTAPVTKFFLQVGSFPKQADADRVRAQIILLGQVVTVESTIVKNITWYRVLVGPFNNRKQLAIAQKQLTRVGFSNLLLHQR
ncbi:SPOR domain-containing protein [Candidatus Pseudomonas adelgestsugas]|uniref:SPOR domain-containing protein n=1 Tax=Candidatus Pseudomonas adelgestsugas TaxID=1302376 RepID=UPI00100DD206|nr:SPOR domain-containing protein [Candidatus Pseudomonas adelgestsugas]